MLSIFSSKRTTNQILTNLALSHDHVAWEMKRKAEIVLAAPTSKQAGALARNDNSGGDSKFSDNVGKVVHLSYFSYILHNHFCRDPIANITAHSRLVNSFISSP